MFDLQFRAEFDKPGPPFVVKVAGQDGDIAHDGEQRSLVTVQQIGRGCYELANETASFRAFVRDGDPIEGDVLICFPRRGRISRIFRRASKHNTILFTERCDQLCAMCSQPPKDKEYRPLFPLFEEALTLVDRGIMMGISGGEPTLYKDELLGMIERVSETRPDVSYHVLTNGQHFDVADRARLSALHDKADIVWGVPLYSHVSESHDKIVDKTGAFNKVMENLFLLASTGAQIELRTVIMAPNYLDIPHLANFIGKHLPFIGDWAVMGMEPIGYAKANRKQLFIDHNAFPAPLITAVEISRLRGLPCHLYNIPLCTVPEGLHNHCVDSIADWKKKHLPECDNCRLKGRCPGFFEWYNDLWAWSGVRPQ